MLAVITMKRFDGKTVDINEIEVCGESNATLSAVMRTGQLIGISHPTCVYATTVERCLLVLHLQ